MRTHSLPDRLFQEICAGPVSEATMAYLKATQYSLRKLRLLALLQVVSPDSGWEAQWEALADAEQQRPEVVRDVLMYPPVGVWLVDALRSGRDDLGYLDRLVEATRTGIPGTAHHSEAQGLALDVVIDDSDPYREFGAPLKSQPLAPSELARWQRLLDDAWLVLTERHSAYAKELAAGLRAVVPIVSDRRVTGASSRAAFGGVALSKKDSPVELAEVLIHELQHSKINALLELIPLQEGDAGQMWYAPWRSDSRPLVGVLHGIYAFSSVVEFWQVEQPFGRAAQFAYSYRRQQVLEAVDNIRHAPDLTKQGRQLIEATATRMAGCDVSSVDPEVLDLVTRLTDDHRTIWRIQHLEYDEAAVNRMATAWLDRSSAPELPAVVRVKANVPSSSTHVRLEIVKAKALQQDVIRTDGPDLAYLRGDHDSARAGYLARIRQVADDVDAWAGLALTTRSFKPDVTFAVYKAIRSRHAQAPDPIELAAWMGS